MKSYIYDICLTHILAQYTKNIPDPVFQHLLFYMKPDTISIIISRITDLPL